VAKAKGKGRADRQYDVAVASTLLIAWSGCGRVIPLVTTALTPVIGAQAFMYVAMAIAAIYGAFVLFRMTRREPTPEADTAPYQPITAQAPHTPELAPLPEE